jgi:hypothetical protein
MSKGNYTDWVAVAERNFQLMAIYSDPSLCLTIRSIIATRGVTWDQLSFTKEDFDKREKGIWVALAESHCRSMQTCPPSKVWIFVNAISSIIKNHGVTWDDIPITEEDFAEQEKQLQVA